MKSRRKLRYPELRLGLHDVAVENIPLFPRPFEMHGISEVELGGAAPKDLLALPGTSKFTHAYIAKGPVRHEKIGPRECATEYLISEVGRILPLKVARGRLVRLSTGLAPDVRFLSRYFLKHGSEELRHGIELVAASFEMSKDNLDHEVRRSVPPQPGGRGSKGAGERSFYTVDLIDEVLGRISANDANHLKLRCALARMLAFDALVGAHDRHAENWGVIFDISGRFPPRFAPIYDTAKGLFGELSDNDLRERIDKKGQSFIEEYAERSLPLIGTGDDEKVNHFNLIKYMVAYPSRRYRAPVTQVFNGFRRDQLRRVLHDSCCLLFSRFRLEAVEQLICYRHQRLSDICKSARGERK